MATCAVLLAAGGGSRFSGPSHKLLATLNGRPVWRWSLDAVVAAGFPHVVVVTGAALLDVPAPAVVHHNPEWAQGQATSLQVGLTAAAGFGADAVIVGLADQPFVTTAAWQAVAGASSEHAIAVATYEGTRGPNPVLLRREVWPLLPKEGDEGARRVIAAHPLSVIEVPCVGSVADIDTLEDLERWTSC